MGWSSTIDMVEYLTVGEVVPNLQPQFPILTRAWVLIAPSPKAGVLIAPSTGIVLFIAPSPELEYLSAHGAALSPAMVGLTDEQVLELKLTDDWTTTNEPSGGYSSNKWAAAFSGRLWGRCFAE